MKAVKSWEKAEKAEKVEKAERKALSGSSPIKTDLKGEKRGILQKRKKGTWAKGIKKKWRRVGFKKAKSEDMGDNEEDLAAGEAMEKEAEGGKEEEAEGGKEEEAPCNNRKKEKADRGKYTTCAKIYDGLSLCSQNSPSGDVLHNCKDGPTELSKNRHALQAMYHSTKCSFPLPVRHRPFTVLQSDHISSVHHPVVARHEHGAEKRPHSGAPFDLSSEDETDGSPEAAENPTELYIYP